jgi:hypothetical protein
VAEIEDRGQGSQDDALRRGWGKKFSFLKLVDRTDIFQESESPSKRRKLASKRQPHTERSPTTSSPSYTASLLTSTMPTPPPATGSTMGGGESSLEDTRRRTALTRSQGTTWGRMGSTRSLGGSGQSDHQSDHRGTDGAGGD